jgi:hypothetical protein
MAGEQYAKITIQVALSYDDDKRAAQTASLRFLLARQAHTFVRGGGPSQFVVPDPNDVGDKYVLQTVQHVLALLRGRIGILALPYEVSAPREVGTVDETLRVGSSTTVAQMPLVEFDLTATAYGQDYNLDFTNNYPSGWAISAQRSNLSPISATAVVTHATVFGRADGAIAVTATSTDLYGSAFFLYAWDDGGSGATRTQLRAGTYGCTVSYSTGVTTRLVVEVRQDPQLVVQVTNTPNSITLQVSGGVAPYTIAWADGATTAVRTNLPEATYHYVVTDAHGAVVAGDVVLSFNSRYWFAGNPITLSLDAGAAYRAHLPERHLRAAGPGAGAAGRRAGPHHLRGAGIVGALRGPAAAGRQSARRAAPGRGFLPVLPALLRAHRPG